jgi:hypothetical protein
MRCMYEVRAKVGCTRMTAVKKTATWAAEGGQCTNAPMHPTTQTRIHMLPREYFYITYITYTHEYIHT